MSQFADNLWTTKFGTEVTHRFQQETAKLEDTVVVVRDVNDRIYRAPVFDVAQAFDEQPRGSDVQYSNNDMGFRDCVLTDTYAAALIHSPDEFRSNVNYRTAFMDSLWSAIYRKLDARIIDALHAGQTTSITLPTANTYDRLGMVAMTKRLRLADIQPGPDVVAVISPGAEEDMLADQVITSADYMDEKGLQNGMISRVLGARHIVHNYLPVPAANQRRIFRYHKKAVHLAISQAPTARIDWVAHKRAWQVLVEFQAGAVVTWNTGIVAANIAD